MVTHTIPLSRDAGAAGGEPYWFASPGIADFRFEISEKRVIQGPALEMRGRSTSEQNHGEWRTRNYVAKALWMCKSNTLLI
jgi:hypothetical protein